MVGQGQGLRSSASLAILCGFSFLVMIIFSTLIVFWSTIENVIEIFDHCDDDGKIRINDGKIIAGCVCTCGRG